METRTTSGAGAVSNKPGKPEKLLKAGKSRSGKKGLVGGKAGAAANEASRRTLKQVVGKAFQASDLDRVALIRAGLPAIELIELSDAMAISRDRLFGVLQLPRSTVDRKIRDKARLSPEHSERVMGLERLIGQVAAMVDASGAKGFDAGRWVGDWLDRPLPALGGARPGDYMDTIEGQGMVARLLAQTQSGAYG